MTSHSKFTDIFAFLATIKGDLSNIAAPPFFLAPLSVVELPSCWTERPSVLAAPAAEPDPQKRALLVLRWILCSLKSQFYIGQDTNAGMRKPLNAFLGELFFGQWTENSSTAKLISEQVSHHPPITACYMWDDENGIRGDGYTRVEMSFSGSLNVKQTGHAILHLDKYSEDYLIPIPNFRVKGFLSGCLYPELFGTYYVISSTGFISEIIFSGKGFFSGVKNSFEAKMYRREDNSKTPIYVASGQWSGKFAISSPSDGTDIENCDLVSPLAAPLHIPELADQDPWETRKAWKHVLTALAKGNMKGVINEKSKLEEAQRAMRKKEEAEKIEWEPKFFTSVKDDPVFDRLASATGWKLHSDRTKGVWKFDREKAEQAKRPYYGELTPFG